MGASLGLAGVTACTRQPRGDDRPLRPSARGDHPGQAALLRDRDDARRRRHGSARREPRRTPDEDRRQPGSSRQPRRHRCLRQAAILDLYDPDRSRAVTNLGEIRPWADFLAIIRNVLAAQEPRQGAGLRILTRISQLADARRADSRAADTAPDRRSGTDGIPPAPIALTSARAWPSVKSWRRSTEFDQADVIVSLDCDFLGGEPGRLRYARDFASRRRPEDAERMNRLYAIETHAEPHRDRAPIIASRSGPAGSRARRWRWRARWVSAVSPSAAPIEGVNVEAIGQRSFRASGCEPRDRRLRPAADRPRARARDERRARQRRTNRRLHGSGRSGARRSARSRSAS